MTGCSGAPFFFFMSDHLSNFGLRVCIPGMEYDLVREVVEHILSRDLTIKTIERSHALSHDHNADISFPEALKCTYNRCAVHIEGSKFIQGK